MDKKKNNALAFIFEVTGRKKINVLWLLICQAVYGASGIFYALLIRGVIDKAVLGQKKGFFVYVCLFVALVVFQLVLRAAIRFLEEYSKSTFENLFKERLFYTLLTRDYKNVSKTHSGEWMNRLTSDTQIASDGFSTIVPGLVGMVVRIIGALGMILFLEPKFAFILIPGGILLVLLTYGFRRVLKRLHKSVQEKDGVARAFMQENLESAMVVRAFAVEAEARDEAARLFAEHKRARIKRNHFSNFCNVGFGVAMQGAYALGLAYCGYGLLEHTMTYGTLMAILQLIGQVQGPFANISGYIPRYYAMIASAERLMEAEGFEKEEIIYKTKEEIRQFYKNEFTSIELKNIDFSYDEDNEVLKDYSLTIEKGEFVAFTGMSGCGKSTVLKLILGLYKAHKGEINVDNSYRRLFAYVPQGNLLMSGKIIDVVTMANTKDKANSEKLKEAIKASCSEFVYDLPEGLNTELGERGLGLSEGQMQRLAVARAIFSECPVLILDEATSALDSETEKRLLENIKALSSKTVLIVTHRPAALSVCDRQISF